MVPREIGGVVDHSLRVYGTKNLRVVDASVIPLQLGATPMSTIYAIAEKVSTNSLWICTFHYLNGHRPRISFCQRIS